MGERNRVQFQTTFDKELLERLKGRAKKERRNVNAILEYLIEEYLKKCEEEDGKEK